VYREDVKHNAIAIALLLVISACSETGYQQTGNSVSYITWDEAHGRREHPVAGVDPRSFQVLNKQGYAKDRLGAYFRWNKIETADSASFTALSEHYAKDRRQAFYEDKPIAGTDPASFEIINEQWARDRRDVYLQNRPIEACHPPTFALLEENWQRDRECVYNRGRKLPAADPSTFTVLNFWFGKDESHVYHSDGHELAVADAKTFAVAKPCEVCGKDALHCYRFREVVPCAAK
jgi:hypothetical protein